MAWNNVYLGTPTPVGNYQGSAATTVLSGVSLTGALQGEIASASAISGGAITGTTGTFSGALVGGSTLSLTGQLNGAGATFTSTISSTDNDFLSVNSVANSSGMTVGQLRLVFQASGVSLIYSSGKSYYEVGSARSAAQA